MTIFIQEQKKLKKLHYGDLNEIVLKNFLNQQKNIPVLPPFSLNTIYVFKAL